MAECKACDVALEEYDKVRDVAWAEYDKVRRVALAEYDKVCDAHPEHSG